MTRLDLELFTGAAYDFEQAQYRVLAALQKTREAFSENKIYPHLGELVSLHSTLQTILDRSEGLKGALPKEIDEVDFEEKEIRYRWPQLADDKMEVVRELITWAMPQIRAAIEEGRAIYEFVEDHMHMEEVGLVPSYVQEGYVLVPAREEEALHILKYEMSIFTSSDEQYRSLKTKHLKRISWGKTTPPPQSVKLDLLEEYRELPNPATYYFETELDFPFRPTVFPVAKRTLMRYLTERGQA